MTLRLFIVQRRATTEWGSDFVKQDCAGLQTSPPFLSFQ